MNKEAIIIRQGLVIKPFEARLASEELKARVKFFQKILNQSRNKSKLRICKINKYNH